jgi:parallel beta-helix repeat protein
MSSSKVEVTRRSILTGVGIAVAGGALTVGAAPAQAATTDGTQLSINAKTFGAAGDGITDDTAALQAILDAISPGDVIDLGNGTYLHDHLTVTGKSRFAIIGDGALLRATTTTDRYLRFLDCADFTIRGVSSSGFDPTVRQGPTRGFSFEACSRFHITDCAAFNTEGVGIMIAMGCTDGRVSNNLVHDTLADGIHTTGGSKRISIIGNALRDTGDDSIAVVSYQSDLDIVENVTISGNTAYRSRSRGITIAGGKSVTVTGNTIGEPKNAGIYVAYESSYNTYGVQDITITGNIIGDANTYDSPATDYAGIHVVGNSTSFPVSGLTIVGNAVEGSAWHGILVGSAAVGCYGFLVAQNNVRNSGASGLIVQAITDVSVHGNFISSCVSTGVVFVGTRGVLSIANNTVRDPNTATPGGTGIHIPVSAAARGVVTGNIVYDSIGNTATPLSVSTAVNLAVYGNVIGGNLVGSIAGGGLPFVAPGNALLCGALESNGTGGGVGVVGMRNASTIPVSNPGSGGVMYVQNGALMYRDANGTICRVAGTLRTVRSSYSVLPSDQTILANGTGITIRLPSAVTVGAGREFRVKNIGSASVTLSSTAGSIDGASTLSMLSKKACTVVSDGAHWRIL